MRSRSTPRFSRPTASGCTCSTGSGVRSDGAVVASAEQMLLHVDTAAGKTVAAEGEVLATLQGLAARHAGLPRPKSVGRSVGLRDKA